jgi:hypothetical protein
MPSDYHVRKVMTPERKKAASLEMTKDTSHNRLGIRIYGGIVARLKFPVLCANWIQGIIYHKEKQST